MAKTLKTMDELMEELKSGQIKVETVKPVVEKPIQPVNFKKLVDLASAKNIPSFWIHIGKFGISQERGQQIWDQLNPSLNGYSNPKGGK